MPNPRSRNERKDEHNGMLLETAYKYPMILQSITILKTPLVECGSPAVDARLLHRFFHVLLINRITVDEEANRVTAKISREAGCLTQRWWHHGAIESTFRRPDEGSL